MSRRSRKKRIGEDEYFHTSEQTENRPFALIISTIHALIVPILFTVAIWFFCFNAEYVSNELLPLKPYLPWNGNTIEGELPPYPKSLYDTWQFSQLEFELRLIENNQVKSSLTTDDILEKASSLAKRRVTSSQLHQMAKYLKEIDEEGGIITKVLGFFSFINIIWGLSFLGILITCSPVIYYVANPIFRLFEVIVLKLQPIVLSGAAFQVYHIMGYVFVYLWIIAAYQYNEDISYILGLFGWILSAVLMITFTSNSYIRELFFIRGMMIISPSQGKDFITLFFVATTLPMTFLFKSTLFGWIAVVNFYSMIGFCAGCYTLCYFVGFSSRDVIPRCIISSLVLIITFSTCKVLGVAKEFISPFGSPCITFGIIVYFLALLIISAGNYSYQNRNYYPVGNILMVISLIASLLLGNIFAIWSIVNTGYTFLIFYLLEIIGSMKIWYSNPAGIWVLFFLGSVLLFCGAFFLHGHPGIIVSLFDSAWLSQ